MDRLEKAIEIVKRFNDEYCKRSPCCTDCKKLDECNAYFGEDRPYELLEPLLLLDEQIFKEYNIQLKNIDLSNVSYLSQKNKVKEKRKEFTDAAGEYNLHIRTRIDSEEFKEIEAYSKNYMIETFWDMVQAGLGLIQKTGISAEEVMAEYSKHLEKIKKIN